MMKQGNQFYLEVEITDDNDELLDINAVSKVQFNIDKLTKNYDGQNEEVTYSDGKFKIWLTEKETFSFKGVIQVDARVLFKNNLIAGTRINEQYIFKSLKEVYLDVENENN